MTKRLIAIGLLSLAVLGLAAIAQAEVGRSGNVQVKVSGNLAPQRLPRQGDVPISVSFAGQISTTDASEPPRLETLEIDINRYGHIDTKGLQICNAAQIRTASSARALTACRRALVGRGKFWADIYLSGGEPYEAEGRLLVFNGRLHGRSVLLGHIYSPRPFATSFVIPFAIRKVRHGRYGTELSARFPKSMGSWGNVTGIEMKLSRRYFYRGSGRSFVSASCPAPKGFPGTVFVLARTSFGFAGGRSVSTDLQRNCKVRGR